MKRIFLFFCIFIQLCTSIHALHSSPIDRKLRTAESNVKNDEVIAEVNAEGNLYSSSSKEKSYTDNGISDLIEALHTGDYEKVLQLSDLDYDDLVSHIDSLEKRYKASLSVQELEISEETFSSLSQDGTTADEYLASLEKAKLALYMGVANNDKKDMSLCTILAPLLNSPLPPNGIKCKALKAVTNIASYQSATDFRVYKPSGEPTDMMRELVSYNWAEDERLRAYPQLLKVYNQEGHPSLPLEFPQDVLEHEKPTLFLYYHMMLRLYSVAIRKVSGDENRANEATDYPPINGYTTVDVVYQEEDVSVNSEFNPVDGFVYSDTPTAFTVVKELPDSDVIHAIVTIRGTMSTVEWKDDFDLVPETIPGVPGLVTHGFKTYNQKHIDHLNLMLDRLRNQYSHKHLKVTFTGHSLGGASAILVASDLYANWGFKDIEVVTFGAPFPGNQEFADWFYCWVNLRMIRYVGQGLTYFSGPHELIHTHQKRGYTIGDLVPQILSCAKIPECPSSTLYYQGPWYGVVDFTSSMMPNSAMWQRYSDVVYIARNLAFGFGAVAPHVCSYNCYLNPFLDNDDAAVAGCKFTGQDTKGFSNYCHLEWDVTYPSFTGTPEQIAYLQNPIIHEFASNLL